MQCLEGHGGELKPCVSQWTLNVILNVFCVFDNNMRLSQIIHLFLAPIRYVKCCIIIFSVLEKKS